MVVSHELASGLSSYLAFARCVQVWLLTDKFSVLYQGKLRGGGPHG